MARAWLPVAFALVAAPERAAAQAADSETYTFLLAELLEYQLDDGTNPAAWELLGWTGGDYNRIWFKSEGAATTSDVGEVEGEVQVLYGRLVTPFWDFQIGVRGDLISDEMDTRGRAHAMVGLEGLAPGWFDIDLGAYVSHEGDVSGRLTATYAVYITQRLVAEPRFEINAAVQDVEQFGVGSGLSILDLGLRIRYEVRRELAPYLGIAWERSFFDTAMFARARGEDPSTLAAVAGIRAWL
jgi:copper resistance protein B